MNRMEHGSWIRKNRWKAVFNFLLVSPSPCVDITSVGNNLSFWLSAISLSKEMPEGSPDLLKGEAKGMGIEGFHLFPVHVLVIQTQCEGHIRFRNISPGLKM